MKRIYNKSLVVGLLTIGLVACGPKLEKVEQISIERVTLMPNHPTPYKMIDWSQKALDYDNYIFDLSLTGEYRPFIWFDSTHRNIPQETFGIYTVIGDVRQGPGINNGEFHEAINSLGALLGATLVGIDKSNQDGNNYVKMVQNYFNSDTGWNIVMNNTNPEVAMLGGGYGRDWWYDVFPNLLFYALAYYYPDEPGIEEILHSIAEQFYKADSVLDGNYDYSYFDYATLEGKRNQIVYQQDAAAGHAYVLYSAYKKFGDEKYLEGAKSALEALFTQKEGRFYEILMPFGAYVAARLNAEHNTHYDFHKILDWTFNETKAEDGRTGWGVIGERWGDYDVHGLQGSITHDGGYAFLMNTFDLAWALVPIIRYDQRYARAIGKWMLNASNAARLFYPNEIPDKNQWLPDKKEITKNVIAYEGLKKTDMYNAERLKGVSPVALGDGPNWVVNQPELSMFSLYGSSHVGIFGSIIKKTNVEEILQIDCLPLDFYRDEAYPTYLYYNPFDKPRQITINAGEQTVNLFDTVERKVIAENVNREVTVTIPANHARVIVMIPAKKEIRYKEHKVWAGDIVISYM